MSWIQRTIVKNFFPNPANSFITITNTTDNATVKLYNMQGQLVLTNQLCSQQYQFDFSELANGCYFALIQNENTSKTIKFTIAH